MTQAQRGRVAPSPPLPYPGSSTVVVDWAHSWNTPRPALPCPEKPLTHEYLLQGQAVLANINKLPQFLRTSFIARYEFLLANKGLNAANKWLVFVFNQRIWPRIKNYLLYIQHHPSNCLTSNSFRPPHSKTLWQQFIELINRRLEP
ncbi:TPA: hypothetical protein ACPZAW_004334 [Yersinia enterocolitica]|nr:hypothetical protein [Yersinia enterocolitica]